MLIVPQKQIWTQQPQQAGQIDYAGLGKGVKMLLMQSGGGLVDVANPAQIWTAGGNARSEITGKGPASSFDGSGDYFYTTGYPQIVGAKGTFFMWLPRVGAFPANGPVWLVTNTGGIVAFQSNSSGRAFCFGSGQVDGTTVIENTANTSAVFTANGTGLNTQRYYRNGVSEGTANGSNATAFASGDKLFNFGRYMGGSGWDVNADIVVAGFTTEVWGAAEAKAFHETPWKIFRASDSRIFVPTGAGAAAGAVLGGNAQAQATATGNLTLKADLDAVALSVATASGNLTTFIPLTGAAVAIGAASGALTSGIKLSAAATASALASGSLVAQIKLNGAALAQAAASAGLTSAILLAGSAQGQATASGTLAAAPGSMAGNAQAQATVVATLTTSIRLSGAAAAQAGVSGLLTTNISLTAAALAQAIATGTLAVPILLAGAAHGVASATGTLTTTPATQPGIVYHRLNSGSSHQNRLSTTATRTLRLRTEARHV